MHKITRVMTITIFLIYLSRLQKLTKAKCNLFLTFTLLILDVWFSYATDFEYYE